MDSHPVGHRLQVVGPDGAGGLKPPHSPEVEREVLSCAFIGGLPQARRIVERCKPSDFFLERHQTFLRALINICTDRPEMTDLDPVTFCSELRSMGAYERVGGIRAVSEILDRSGISTNLDHYIDLLLDFSTRRKVVELGRFIEVKAFDDTVEVRDLLSDADKRIRRVREERPAFIDTPSAKSLTLSLCDKYTAKLVERKVRVVSGMTKFDNGFGQRPGFGELQKGRVYIIQGKPSHGKTAFAVNNFLYNTVSSGGCAFVWSRDMSAEQIMQRVVAADSGVPFFVQERGAPWDEEGNIRTNGMSAEDWSRVVASLDRVSNFRLFIDDVSRSCDQAWERARSIKQEEGPIDLFVVDYLQLIRGPTGRRMDDYEVITDACQTLKEWTKRDYLDCPGLLLSQPDKASRKGEAPAQTLADGKGSGAIEEVADAGWVVEQIQDGSRRIRVVKDRWYGLNGVVYGAGDVRFDGARMRFVDEWSRAC